MHQFGPNHSNPIIDFWLSKKSIFSISSGIGELGCINVPSNLVDHVALMKVANIPEYQKDQEDSEPEPETFDNPKEEEPNVPDLKMNPTSTPIKISSQSNICVEFNSQGQFCILGEFFYKGQISAVTKPEKLNGEVFPT